MKTSGLTISKVALIPGHSFGRILGFIALLIAFTVSVIGAPQFGVSVVTQKSPAKITLSWDTVPWGNATYAVYRSTAVGGYPGGGGAWSAIASGLTTTSYVDTNVQAGVEYEYRINRSNSEFNGDTYLLTGIEIPLIESRGKLLLLVDNTFSVSVGAELTRLQEDLTGDGWTVIRRDVARSETANNVRNIIKTEYAADPANLKSVFIVGHLAVLRSGNLNPDGHGGRPFPADTFYGEVDATWSNPSALPSDVDLQVGRVDFFNMPSFAPLTEADLIRRYLNKDHDFRHKVFSVPTRSAHMTTITGNTFQRQFFGSGTPRVIMNNYYQTNGYYSPEFWNEVEQNAYLWFVKGSGGGAYTSCTGMGSTYHYAASSGVKTVFNATFASWFGEWDVQDAFLRAPLAAKGYNLVNLYSDNPTWVLHHMALGKTIGFTTRVSQNNDTYYNLPWHNGLPVTKRPVFTALMGDPSLRAHVVAPPSNLNGGSSAGNITLTWNASPDAEGYNIYRSTNPSGPFSRINANVVTGGSYVNAGVGSGTFTYMVRAVKLEVTPSGSFTNASQGVFKTVSTSGAVGVNVAPAANAGADQSVTLPTMALLTGTVTDDGLPNPPANVTKVWSQISGPGTVSFGNSAATSTTAAFNTAGTYVLRLTAFDGALSSFDEVTITVSSTTAPPDDRTPAGGTNYVTSPSAPDSNTVVLYHFDNNYADASGRYGALTPAGTTHFETNTAWMQSPSGASLRFTDLGDSASIVIPGVDLYVPGQTEIVALETMIYIKEYRGFGRQSAPILRLTKRWDTQMILNQDMWSQQAEIIGGNQKILDATTLAQYLKLNCWQKISLCVDHTGYIVKVNDVVVLRFASADSSKWTGASDVTLQIGNFDGWMDELVLKKSSGSSTTPPQLPVVTIAATDASASEAAGNTATFTLARTGATTSALTANYSVSGTATSGTDFQTLGGSVTFVAGASTATVVVTPTDDTAFEGTETVTLALATSAAYQLGATTSSTASIVDNDFPKLNITATHVVNDRTPSATGPHLNLAVPAVPGVSYLVQLSTNLSTWQFISTNQSGTALQFVDEDTGSHKQRYYRIVFVIGDPTPANIAASLAAKYFSESAVGWINITVPPGLSLIANPLISTNNTITGLFPTLPDGTQFYKYDAKTGYNCIMYDSLDNGWAPHGNLTLNPGEAGFIRNNSQNSLALSVIGEVPHGNLSNPLPAGYSTKSSMVPQAGQVDSVLGLPIGNGDVVLKNDPQTGFIPHTYTTANGWQPRAPVIEIGEGFFINKAAAATWTRSFNPNN